METVEDKAVDIRTLTLLLATKISELEKEDLDMWDEVITYLTQREQDKDCMEYEKFVGEKKPHE